MAVRSFNGRNIVAGLNCDFQNSPAGVPTTTGGRWIDGTAGGSPVNTIYRWRLDNSGSARAGFEVRGNSSVMKVSTTATGSYAEVRNDDNFYATTLQYGIKLIPGRTYRFTYSMETNYVSGDSAGGAFAAVMTARPTGAFSRSIEVASRIKTTTANTIYTGTFVTAANEDKCHIELYVYGHTGAGTLIMDAWFDNIKIEEVLPARTIATARTTATNRVATRDMGTALSFDGVDDRVDTGKTMTQLGLNLSDFSVSVWYRTPQVTNTENIIATRNIAVGTNIGFNLIVNSGNLQAILCDGSATRIITTSTGGGYANNVWRQATATFDRDGLMSLYSNGQLIQSTSIAAQQGSIESASNIGIGVFLPTGSPIGPGGVIDEPRIWSRALTAQEVSDLYFNNIVPRDSLVAEYLFNEASGTTALDSSGNGNNGTITGSTYTTDVPLTVRGTI